MMMVEMNMVMMILLFDDDDNDDDGGNEYGDDGNTAFWWCRWGGWYPIYPTPPLGQDMTQGQFLSGV